MGFEADKIAVPAPVAGEGDAAEASAAERPAAGCERPVRSALAEGAAAPDEPVASASDCAVTGGEPSAAPACETPAAGDSAANPGSPVPYGRPPYAAPAGPPPRHFSGESAVEAPVAPVPASGDLAQSGAGLVSGSLSALPPRLAQHATSHPDPEEPEDAVMSLADHLGELRNRLLVCLCSIGGLTLLCLFFSGWLIDWLKATAPSGLRFYTTNPTEAFSVYVKTAAISGLVLSTPLIFHQCWEFIRPGLHTTERQYTRIFVPAFALFFFTGAGFARYVAVPMGVAFLVEFAQGIAEPIYTVGDYTSFVLELMLICGVLFEFPILLFLMASVGLISSDLLRRKRKLVVFWIFVASAGLTPSTDVGTQMAMALPIVLLFEATIVVLRMRGM